MDPGGSELDSSLPQPENPCLIVEDSQPDSVALEDDPESSYRALLARRLSSLQPAARSPVLELISSPVGSRCSQTDSQSESSKNNNSQTEPDILTSANQSSGFQEERQVLNEAPPPNSKRCSAEAHMDSGADSTTHGVHTEEGTSQLVLLELSQSQDQDQDLRGEQNQPAAEQNIRSGSSQSQDHRTFRSEVSSSSSEPRSSRQLTVQDLLHSQNQDQQDSDILSSQEDLFGAEKTGAAVDSTVSEPEQKGQPTASPAPTHTPAHTLHLLHLSGQGTLVQQSLSQSSVDFVAPTPENFSNTPVIVPSSPTGPPDRQVSAAEPMDTSLLPDEKDDEPMETGAYTKPLPSASTPLSQKSPGFVLERPLSVPSQPDLSHDVFVATQSSEVPHMSENKNPPVPESSLSMNCSLVLQTDDDSQATQIQDDDEEGVGPLGVDTTDSAPANHHKTPNSNGISKKPQSASPTKRLSQPDINSKTFNIADRVELNSCVMETPSDSASSLSVISQTTTRTTVNVRGQNSLQKIKNSLNVEEEVELSEGEELESVTVATSGGGASGLALALSQSQLDESAVMVTDSDRDSQKEASTSQPIRGKGSTNGHHTKEGNKAFYRLSQTERVGPDAEGTKDKSLDSSGEISFHFTLPKEGELIGPAMGATPPLISQLKQTLRHSTPIEINSFSEKPDVAASVSNASDIIPGESGEDSAERADGKLSLRMKLVTPVEEGSSERFSLQKPTLAEEDGSVVKVTTVAKAVTIPSVFSRVRQVHRQQEDGTTAENHAPVRAALFASSSGCNSLPNSQSDPSQQGVGSVSQGSHTDPASSPGPMKERRGLENPDPKTQSRTEPGQKVPHQACDGSTPSPSKRPVSHQPPVDIQRSPSFRRTTGPAHRRHVRTIQEVRTTVTRIITDVFYEDGREVERKVTEESEEPVVDCQVLDSDVSPCQTGSSSLASGDLADISSLSSKACSLQHSSGGMSGSSSGGRLAAATDFILPPSRAKATSPRRGGGQPQRGHRGQRAGLAVAKGRGQGAAGSRVPVPLSPRGGGARRGRPPSRPSSLSRGGGVGVVPRVGGHLHSSSEDERFSSALLPRLPVSPAHGGSAHAESLRSLPEEASSAGSSFVGLRVVAKWSSNGYFYSGRIIKDAGEGRFRLRFDDGYECEVPGKDILLCDPIPLETEVTALLEDEYFSTGVVKGHKTEGQDLFYHVERGDQRQWYNRTSVILSLDQGNRLREQHSLGPYEPAMPLAKASDISLDNLVEGKRRRRGAPDTPTRTTSSSSSSSPRTPGPSGKRRLMSPEADRTGRTPPKRGRRGGNRSAQRPGVCNTSGSGTDGAGPSHDPADTHGPLPPNASLFMGFAFMLTASSESDRLTNRPGGDSDEGEDDYVQTGPYNKTYTEAQLQAGGGFVLPDFNEEQCKAAYQSLLIADQHCRTRKYLLCVASGVPCVSHMWVRDCCKENKLLNYRNYLLPAGAGPDGAIVEWHPRSSPFKALKVLLVFQKPPELWAQLITLGGGAMVRQLHPDKDGSDLPSGKYDVVVTNAACPPSLEMAVTSQEVPLVSPEWLIQSLICGERLGFHSRPQYRHDFTL